MPLIAIVGAGPGLGLAIARRFGREGFKVALISRAKPRLDALAAELTAQIRSHCSARSCRPRTGHFPSIPASITSRTPSPSAVHGDTIQPATDPSHDTQSDST
jgi:NAD(P)-dependent dehydrogenase (short-subunit alcohol dehydrogenase family)